MAAARSGVALHLMYKKIFLTRILSKLSRSLGIDQLNRSNADLLTRLDGLETELACLKSRDNQQVDDEELRAIKLLFETLKSSLTEKMPYEQSRMKALRELAQIADSTVFSDQAEIENTLGDKNAITVGEHSYVRGHLLTFGHGGRIAIGDWCYVGARTEIWSMNSISIGKRVLISHDVNIHDGAAHSSNPFERHEHYKRILLEGHPRTIEEIPGLKSAPIVIEDDAWISFGVTILRGVTIGAGSVIAAGSIVTKDVPPNMLYQCEIKPLLKPLPKFIAPNN
jgi:acetyltransferase-like isoleucine patch superfamily enzyme